MPQIKHDSQIKLHRITTKVRKIMFYPHLNFKPCSFFFFFFFDQHENSADLRDPHELCKSLQHLWLRFNGSETPPIRIFQILRTCSGWWLPNISMSKKHFQSRQYCQKYCLNWCHFEFFLIKSRHTAWLKDTEAVAP